MIFLNLLPHFITIYVLVIASVIIIVLNISDASENWLFNIQPY